MAWDGDTHVIWLDGGPRTYEQRAGRAIFDPSERLRHWLMDNMRDGFWWDDDGIRFQSERDAVLFKMWWC